MTRIIAGHGKGRRLKSPKGLATRPTGGRVKQTLFDILAPAIPGCRFLDLFAGNGGLGLEALSRGASRVVFVDQSAAAVTALRQNLTAVTGSGGETKVLRKEAGSALRALVGAGERFDIVYLDPPYASDLYEVLLERLGDSEILDERGVVVAEHFHKRMLPERIGRLSRNRAVRVGDHRLTFYRRESGRSD